jgi:hypothetical protein
MRLDITNGAVLGYHNSLFIFYVFVTIKVFDFGRYSTIPWFTRNIHDIVATRSHVYIVTNEQFAKVGRTEKVHFCATPCDSLYGYGYSILSHPFFSIRPQAKY